MRQVSASWNIGGTARHLEHELGGFAFTGPGFYINKTSVLLVVPSQPHPDHPGKPWVQKWPTDAVFRAYVYDCPFSETIFADVAVAPVREDNR